jgi:mannose-6-phosphate isomerase-like protein (cupin superfamily)
VRDFYEISRYRSSFGGKHIRHSLKFVRHRRVARSGGTFDPPRLIAPRHIHYSDDEAWYVLDGKLRVEMGNKEVEVPAGASMMVPRGTPPTYWNPGPEPVRYLLIMTPNIYRLIQNIHTMPERSPAALQNLFKWHDSEFLG